jgi:uncharacterized protein
MKHLISLCIVVSVYANPALAETFRIGSGAINGTYYPAIEMLCQLVNQHQPSAGTCEVHATEGSVANLKALQQGEIEFGVIQGDVLYQAYQGEKTFASQAQPQLRAIMALYPELLALVVRTDSNIHTLADIHGKKINLGTPGSGTAITVNEFLFEAEIEKHSFSSFDIPVEECPQALSQGTIDGYFYMVGHPNKNIRTSIEQAPARLIMLDSVYSLLEKHPYYLSGEIGADIYGLDEAVATFGVKATLVTREDTPSAQIEAMLSALLENFEEFQQHHGVFAALNKQDLVQGLSAPLHSAAKAYYVQKGILTAAKP